MHGEELCGGPARGSAPGGRVPAPFTARRGSAAQSRPPATGARMLPSAPMFHQAGPSGSLPKTDLCDEYGSYDDSHMLRLPMRAMIAITVSSLLPQILNIMSTDTVKSRIHHTRATVRVSGTTHGPAPGLEAKLPRRSRKSIPTGSFYTTNTDQLQVESCSGNFHQIVTGFTFHKVISTLVFFPTFF